MALQPDSETFLSEEESVSLHFAENPAAKKLLDVLVSILSEEYIQKAKENPDIFSI
jgi:hypothetical protein